MITSFGTGGAEKSLLNLIRGLDPDKFKIKVLILGETGPLVRKLDELPCSWTQINFRNSKNPMLILRWMCEILSFRPNLVQGWMYHGSFFALCSRFIWPFSKAFIGIRNQKLDEGTLKSSTLVWVKMLKNISFLAKTCVYNSESAKVSHLKVGFEEESSIVIANGCDINVFSLVDEREKLELRNKYDIFENERVIAYVSRFHPHKDPLTFLESLSILASKGCSFKVICVGDGFSEKNEELIQYLDQHGLREKVNLMENVLEIQDIYRLSDLFVLSSVGEAFPNVILEAMACGVPCLSTDVGPIKDIISDFGVCVPPKSPKIMAKEIVKCLEKKDFDPNKSYLHVKNSFSIEKMAQDFERVWAESFAFCEF